MPDFVGHQETRVTPSLHELADLRGGDLELRNRMYVYAAVCGFMQIVDAQRAAFV
jgi:hypothetical protein